MIELIDTFCKVVSLRYEKGHIEFNLNFKDEPGVWVIIECYDESA